MTKELCIITGVGPGTGSALVKEFSDNGYIIAMLARNNHRLEELSNTFPDVHAYPVDVTNTEAFSETLTNIVTEHGSPSIVIHNAVGGSFGNFQEIDPSVLENNFQINTMALLHLARQLSPLMIEQGYGTIICTGNTSAYRGKSNFAGFAPTKAAQRILAESIARTLNPKGIHVAYLAIDGVIDLDWTRKLFPEKSDDFFCKPQDIAKECFHLAHQPSSCWSFDTIVRPYAEQW